MKMKPSAWGYNWATLSLGGHKYMDLVLQIGGLDARLTTSFWKNIIIVKSKEVKTGSSNSQE
jgi:hypothetical protein